MELKEAVQALSEHSKEDVAKELQSGVQEVWQHIHDIGFSLSKSKSTEKVEGLEAQLTEARSTIEEKDTRIEEIEAKQPDLEAERQTHRTAVEKLESKHAKKVSDLETSLLTTNRKSVLRQLTLELKSLNPVFAEVAAERAMKRVHFAEDSSGDYEVMTESETPFIAANDKSPIQLLAAEIVSDAPKEFVTSNVDRGSGSEQGERGGTEAPVWQQMRDKGKEVGKEDKPRQERVDKMFGVTPV